MNHDDIPGQDDDGPAVDLDDGPGWEQLEELLAMRWREQFDALYGRKESGDVNINSAFPSDYLRADDLKGRTVKVTIDDVTMEKMGEDQKPVVHFVGKDKGLALNKTNALMIASSYGPDTDAWRGKEIEIRPDKTSFQGRIVDCIRVQMPAPVGQELEEAPF